MRVFDPLYGEFQVPAIASQLVMSPEIRRLSQIRLLNSLTPSLATLGEIRRFSHTLGVLHLFSCWKEKNATQFSSYDLDALEVAILLHDVATPPFGHLLEYQLKEQYGWDHESASSELFRRYHAPENSGHQIFAGQTPKVYRAIQKLKLRDDTIDAILKKSHPLHMLIMGTLDFDNIDNVWRMAWALGITKSALGATKLASEISINDDGALIVPRSSRGLLDEWSKLRKSVYEVLVFDSYTVAGQAVLTKALRIAIKSGILTPESWTLTDEDLLQVLSKQATTKKLIKQQYLGELPTSIITLQLKWKDSSVFNSPRETIENDIQEALQNIINGEFIVYIFKEKGSFGKQLNILDEFGNLEHFGETTKSLIIYIFGSDNIAKQAEKNSKEIINYLLTKLGSTTDDILRLSGKISKKGFHADLPLFK